MSDELILHRRLQKAREVLRDDTHLGHQRIVDELDSWIDMDAGLPEFIDPDPCPAHGLARLPAFTRGDTA